MRMWWRLWSGHCSLIFVGDRFNTRAAGEPLPPVCIEQRTTRTMADVAEEERERVVRIDFHSGRGLGAAAATAATAVTIAGLREAFENKKAKDVTAACLQVVQVAADDVQLRICEWALSGFKSNNLAPQRKRLRDWDESTAVDGDRQVPVALAKAIAAKRLRLSAPTHGAGGGETSPPTRLQPSPENSTAPPKIAGTRSLPTHGSVAAPEMLSTRPERSSASVSFCGKDTAPLEVATEPLATASHLAKVFRVAEDKIVGLRKKDNLYSLVDVAVLVTHATNNKAGEQIRRLCQKYPEVQAKCLNFKFQGRRQRDTPVGDIYTVVELIMLLPGKRAALIRGDAARIFVRYHGGDLSMVDNIIENRESQDVLRVEMPSHPARVLGEEVEQRAGTTDEQTRALEERLRERAEASRKATSYDPARMTAEDHRHKDEMNDYFIQGLDRVHGSAYVEVPGHIAILDDFNADGMPRTATALVAAGFPPERILAPNKSEDVVSALRAMSVRSVRMDFRRALDEEYGDLTVAGAYVDSTSGDPHALQGMIDAVCAKSRRGKLVVAYTIVERDFTSGGAVQFTKRVLEMCDYMRGKGFAAQMGEPHRSYFEPVRPRGRRVGTHFWIRGS